MIDMDFNLLLFDLDDTLVKSSHLDKYRGRQNIGNTNNDYLEALRNDVKKIARIYPENILNQIKELYPNLKIGIFTRAPKSYSSTVIGECYPTFEWDCVITFEDVSKTKPHPEGILTAAKRFNITDVTRVLYVGDDKTDIIAAYQSGAYAVLSRTCWEPNWQRESDRQTKSDHYNSLELIPDALVDSPSQLFSLLECPNSSLPALEYWDSQNLSNFPQKIRIESRLHFNHLEAEGKSAPYVSVNILGRYFSTYHGHSKYDFSRKGRNHNITKNILAAKDNCTYPESWVSFCVEYIKRIQEKSSKIGLNLMVCVIPARPGRKPRMEPLLERIALSYKHNYGDGVNFNGTLMRYRDGVASNKELNNEKRFSNIRDHLTLPDHPDLQRYCIMVLDDVVTSGATFFYAEKYLKSAGAGKVHCVALAQTVS